MRKTVLVSGFDHSFYEATIALEKVVYNSKHDYYSEYYDGQTLTENEIVLEREVAR
jgi:hypothetical protein